MKELKELLKPKFTWAGTRLCNNGKALLELLCDDPIFDDDSFYHKFIDFAASALNEKWERDFGEPVRWKNVGKNHEGRNMYQCPKCEQIGFMAFNFCHECGQKLFPPETA
jgi:hypothetical protein